MCGIQRPVPNVDAEVLAMHERKRLKLGDQPIRDIRNIIAHQGVRIFVLPIPEISPMELSGVSWWHDEYGPCILINARNNLGRRSFTLAHEYAHLLCSDPPTVCAYMSDKSEERYADRFATVFLMPSNSVIMSFEDVVGEVDTIPTDKDLGILAAHFGVSLEAMGLRLETLGLMPSGTTNARVAEWEKRTRFFRARKGPKWKRQLGNDFISLALDAYSKGQVSLGREHLATYFGIDLREASMLVNQQSKLIDRPLELSRMDKLQSPPKCYVFDSSSLIQIREEAR